MLRRLYFAGLAAYCLLLFFSIILCKERILFLDSAFYLFHNIVDQSVYIALYRFGNTLVQMPVVLGAKAGLPLQSLMTISSAAFVVYYFACYIICGSALKRYDLALVILLLNTLFAAYTFYWIPSELPLGIALYFVALSLLPRGNQQMNAGRWLAFSGVLITSAFFHPLLVFVAGYSLLYFLSYETAFANRKRLYLVAAFYVTMVAVKMIFFRTPYEHHSFSGLKNFVTQFPDYFTLYSNRQLLANCLILYYWIPIIFAFTLILYIHRRQWRWMVFYMGAVIGYIFLVNICYPTRETAPFYIENLYLPLAVFLALPFIFEILPLLQQRKLALPVFLLVIASGLLRIYFTHEVFTARLDYERRYLDKFGEEKIMVQATRADKDTLQMLWGTPYEFLLLSESERHRPASIIVDENPDTRSWLPYVKNALVVNWNQYKYSDLPSRYFHFSDTTTGYRIIKQGAEAP